MKKSLSLFAALLFVAGVSAQEFVSTEPANRKVLIEEFTGVNCQYCPDGHKIANNIMASHPGEAWAINVHEGPYAARYSTRWGSALADQSGLSGYPAGTVNRHLFRQYSDVTDVYRAYWPNCANQILNMQSPVNVAARATIDARTRVMTVNVEAYFTRSQNVSSNYLNVALLQDSVWGPQSDPQNFYPENFSGGQYCHKHMLRDLLTGQWGEEITTIGQGTLVSRTYHYSIPQAIGDVTISELRHLQLIVFVTETHQEVLTAGEAEITILNDGEPCMLGFSATKTNDCSTSFRNTITLKNPTDNPVKDWVIEFNGEDTTYGITINPGMTYDVMAPSISLPTSQDDLATLQDSVHIRLKGHTVVGGEPLTYSSEMYSQQLFELYVAEGPFEMDLAIDHYGTQTTGHLIKTADCTKPLIFGPYRNRSENYLMPARHIRFVFSPDEAGLYLLRVKDADGMTLASDETGFWLRNASGLVVHHDGNFTKETTCYLFVTNNGSGTYGIDEVANEVTFSIYPNPAVDRLQIETSDEVRRVELIDINGRTVATYGATRTLGLQGLAAGVYVVRVTTDNGIGMQKFVKE